MSTATFRSYSGSAAELYQSFFVPTIAVPVSGELLLAATLRPGERVVDIACGTGPVTRTAAEQVGSTGAVTGIDIAPDMIEVAQSIPAGGAPIGWHVADATSLPLPDGSCDVALCQMGLMFIDDRDAALAEVRRVLAPGGRVVINTPGAIQPRFAEVERAMSDQLDPSLGAFVSVVFSLHDCEDLAALLRGAGFADVSSRIYTTRLELPEPATFLWSYINLTPLGPLVAERPEAARDAMERQVVDAWGPHVVEGTTPVDQPMALAWGARP